MTAIEDKTEAKSSPDAKILDGKVHKKFWCNFCNYESDDLQDYLSHSCRAVLVERGETIPEPTRSECR